MHDLTDMASMHHTSTAGVLGYGTRLNCVEVAYFFVWVEVELQCSAVVEICLEKMTMLYFEAA